MTRTNESEQENLKKANALRPGDESKEQKKDDAKDKLATSFSDTSLKDLAAAKRGMTGGGSTSYEVCMNLGAQDPNEALKNAEKSIDSAKQKEFRQTAKNVFNQQPGPGQDLLYLRQIAVAAGQPELFTEQMKADLRQYLILGQKDVDTRKPGVQFTHAQLANLESKRSNGEQLRADENQNLSHAVCDSLGRLMSNKLLTKGFLGEEEYKQLKDRYIEASKWDWIPDQKNKVIGKFTAQELKERVAPAQSQTGDQTIRPQIQDRGQQSAKDRPPTQVEIQNEASERQTLQILKERNTKLFEAVEEQLKKEGGFTLEKIKGEGKSDLVASPLIKDNGDKYTFEIRSKFDPDCKFTFPVVCTTDKPNEVLRIRGTITYTQRDRATGKLQQINVIVDVVDKNGQKQTKALADSDAGMTNIIKDRITIFKGKVDDSERFSKKLTALKEDLEKHVRAKEGDGFKFEVVNANEKRPLDPLYLIGAKGDMYNWVISLKETDSKFVIPVICKEGDPNTPLHIKPPIRRALQTRSGKVTSSTIDDALDAQSLPANQSGHIGMGGMTQQQMNKPLAGPGGDANDKRALFSDAAPSMADALKERVHDFMTEAEKEKPDSLRNVRTGISLTLAAIDLVLAYKFARGLTGSFGKTVEQGGQYLGSLKFLDKKQKTSAVDDAKQDIANEIRNKSPHDITNHDYLTEIEELQKREGSGWRINKPRVAALKEMHEKWTGIANAEPTGFAYLEMSKEAGDRLAPDDRLNPRIVGFNRDIAIPREIKNLYNAEMTNGDVVKLHEKLEEDELGSANPDINKLEALRKQKETWKKLPATERSDFKQVLIAAGDPSGEAGAHKPTKEEKELAEKTITEEVLRKGQLDATNKAAYKLFEDARDHELKNSPPRWDRIEASEELCRRWKSNMDAKPEGYARRQLLLDSQVAPPNEDQVTAAKEQAAKDARRDCKGNTTNGELLALYKKLEKSELKKAPSTNSVARLQVLEEQIAELKTQPANATIDVKQLCMEAGDKEPTTSEVLAEQKRVAERVLNNCTADSTNAEVLRHTEDVLKEKGPTLVRLEAIEAQKKVWERLAQNNPDATVDVVERLYKQAGRPLPSKEAIQAERSLIAQKLLGDVSLGTKNSDCIENLESAYQKAKTEQSPDLARLKAYEAHIKSWRGYTGLAIEKATREAGDHPPTAKEIADARADIAREILTSGNINARITNDDYVQRLRYAREHAVEASPPNLTRLAATRQSLNEWNNKRMGKNPGDPKPEDLAIEQVFKDAGVPAPERAAIDAQKTVIARDLINNPNFTGSINNTNYLDLLKEKGNETNGVLNQSPPDRTRFAAYDEYVQACQTRATAAAGDSAFVQVYRDAGLVPDATTIGTAKAVVAGEINAASTGKTTNQECLDMLKTARDAELAKPNPDIVRVMAYDEHIRGWETLAPATLARPAYPELALAMNKGVLLDATAEQAAVQAAKKQIADELNKRLPAGIENNKVHDKLVDAQAAEPDRQNPDPARLKALDELEAEWRQRANDNPEGLAKLRLAEIAGESHQIGVERESIARRYFENAREGWGIPTYSENAWDDLIQRAKEERELPAMKSSSPVTIEAMDQFIQQLEAGKAANVGKADGKLPQEVLIEMCDPYAKGRNQFLSNLPDDLMNKKLAEVEGELQQRINDVQDVSIRADLQKLMDQMNNQPVQDYKDKPVHERLAQIYEHLPGSQQHPSVQTMLVEEYMSDQRKQNVDLNTDNADVRDQVAKYFEDAAGEYKNRGETAGQTACETVAKELRSGQGANGTGKIADSLHHIAEHTHPGDLRVLTPNAAGEPQPAFRIDAHNQVVTLDGRALSEADTMAEVRRAFEAKALKDPAQAEALRKSAAEAKALEDRARGTDADAETAKREIREGLEAHRNGRGGGRTVAAALLGRWVIGGALSLAITAGAIGASKSQKGPKDN